MTFPLLPTRNAATKLSIPDPLPKSTIVSPGLSAARMKIVVDAGERVDRLTRDPVDIPRPVAEALGQRAPHLEVIGAVRSFGDIAVHCLDLGFEFAGIKSHGCRHRHRPLETGSADQDPLDLRHREGTAVKSRGGAGNRCVNTKENFA